MTVEGMPQLQAALMRVAAAVETAGAAVVASEVRMVANDAKAGAPRESGELQSGISGEASGMDGVVKSAARHSWFVEAGTYKDRPQPFMGPAADASRARLPGLAASIIGRAANSVSS